MFKNHPLYKKAAKIAQIKIYIMETFLAPIVLLAIRLYVGRFYWQSGMTKFTTPDSALNLFETEYIPNWQQNHIKDIFGVHIPFPVPSAIFGMNASMTGELLFSALLIIGLAGRFAALGIFMMALAIEMFVYPGTDEHYYWLLTMGVIIAHGPGKISIDHWIRRKLLQG
jgi:putative oxidoreductase